MPDMKTLDPSLVAQIVRGYVAHNRLAAGICQTSLPPCIAPLPSWEGSGHAATRAEGCGCHQPILCSGLCCLSRLRLARPDAPRHLTTSHALSPREYRSKWGLKDTHPLTAPAYTARRSALARQLGLGRARQPAQSGAEPAPASVCGRVCGSRARSRIHRIVIPTEAPRPTPPHHHLTTCDNSSS